MTGLQKRRFASSTSHANGVASKRTFVADGFRCVPVLGFAATNDGNVILSR
jgi:hypothetical protein